VDLSNIKYFGFDLDYTLVEYISPATEILTFDLLVRRLVDVGYPAAMLEFRYDSVFAVRGLFYDKVRVFTPLAFFPVQLMYVGTVVVSCVAHRRRQTLGNLLKIDEFGNILTAVHGKRVLTVAEIERVWMDRGTYVLTGRPPHFYSPPVLSHPFCQQHRYCRQPFFQPQYALQPAWCVTQCLHITRCVSYATPICRDQPCRGCCRFL
jgi:hypothetical protein